MPKLFELRERLQNGLLNDVLCVRVVSQLSANQPEQSRQMGLQQIGKKVTPSAQHFGDQESIVGSCRRVVQCVT
jgi:hypothetical protein